MNDMKVCRPVRRNGKIFVCRYTPGYYGHCKLLIDAWGNGTRKMYSGRAEVTFLRGQQ